MESKALSFAKDLLVVDVETTGTNPQFHATVELAGILLDRRTLVEKASMTTLVRIPDKARIDIRAMETHKIAQATIQEQGLPVEEALGLFFETFGFDGTLCGWNIAFDVGFIAAMAQQSAMFDKFLQFDYHHLDMQAVAMFLAATHQIPQHKGMHALMRTLGMDVGHAHRALDDCRTTAKLLRRFAGRDTDTGETK